MCIISLIYILFKTNNFQRQLNASGSLDQRADYNTSASTEQNFSSLGAARDGEFDDSIDSLSGSANLGNLQRSPNREQNVPKSQQLSPNEMIAPVSAAHSMSVNLLSSDNVNTQRFP